MIFLVPTGRLRNETKTRAGRVPHDVAALVDAR